MSAPVRWLASAVLVALWASACGAEEQDVEPPVPSFVTALCAARDGCCAADGRQNDGRRCRQETAAQLTPGAWTEAQAAACEALVRARATAGTYCELGSYQDGVYLCSLFGSGDPPGATPPGGPCDAGTDCLQEAADVEVACLPAEYNPNAKTSPKHICVAIMRGALGEGACVRTRTGTDSAFLPGFHLSPMPPRAVSCDRGQGLMCDAHSKTCQPVVEVGESCDVDERCATPTLACVYSAGSPTYLCLPRRPVGGSCDVPEKCVFGSACENGACVKRKGAGQSCADNDECDAGYCVQGIYCGGQADGRVHGCYEPR